MAINTHTVSAVNTDSAVRTEFINTSRALAALLTYIFGTVCTDNAAFFTDLFTFAALVAIFAEEIIRTFAADITGRTEFV